jgi:hypothetical protein
MTLAAAPREQTTGVIAVVQAFLAQLLAMLRSIAYRTELQRQLRSHEHRLLHGLFGAHLRHDPEFMGRTRTARLVFLRKTGRTLQALRARRIREHLSRTLLGRGFVKHPRTTMAIRFAHRFALRPTRRLSCARLRFVASTRELRAGAPP